MKRETIVVMDFGGQYNQLIARRVRECNVYCEVYPHNIGLDKLKEMNLKGIIFTGGPNSVYAEGSPLCDRAVFELGVPVLGICYGSQLMAHLLGGKVATAPVMQPYPLYYPHSSLSKHSGKPVKMKAISGNGFHTF